MTAAPTSGTPPIGLGTKLLFGIGSIAVGTKTVAFSAYLLLFYNQVMGVSAGVVSLALLISLVIDALTNPVLGQISDNVRTRWGRRHPFMYASALPTAVLFYMMFAPPSGWSDSEMFWYILTVSTLARVAINLYELPSAALTPELSEDYDERTSLMSWRYFFGYLGGLGMAFIALFVFFRPTAQYPVGQLNPAGYQAYGLAGAVVIFLSIMLSTLGTHGRIRHVRQATVRARLPVAAHLREMMQTLNHKGFLAILAFGVMKYTAMGVYGAMAIYFGTFVWELSARSMSFLTLDGVLSAAFALVLAPRLSRRYGKKPVAIVLAIVGVIIGLMPLILRQMGLFWPLDPEMRLVWALLSFQVVYGAMAATSQILVSSMIADVVEDSATRTGRHSSGVFFAASAFMQTCTGGLGVLVAGVILTMSGFPEGARPGQVGDGVVDSLVMTYIPITAALWAIGVCFLLRYRIDRSTHEANLQKLREPGPPISDVAPAEPDFSLAQQKSAPAS